MRSPFLLLLCIFFLNHNFLSAQWLPATNETDFGDIIITGQGRIVAARPITNYSDDGGKTWTNSKQKLTGENMSLKALARQGSLLFGVASNGMWSSANNGESWTPVHTISYPQSYRFFKSSEKCTALVTDEYESKLKITLGQNARWLNTQLPAYNITGLDVHADTVFVSCRNTAYRGYYSNGSWVWQLISSSGENGGIGALNENTYITTSNTWGSFIRDEKKSEEFIIKNSDGATEKRLQDIFILDKYWVITSHKTVGKIFVSKNQGKTWKDFSSGLPRVNSTQYPNSELTISKVFVLKDILYAVVGKNLLKRPLSELADNYLEFVTNVTIDTTKRNTHLIKWTDNSAIEKGFIIERSEIFKNAFEPIATVAKNVESFTDYEMPGGRMYYYRLRSYNDSLYSRYSDTLKFNREIGTCKLTQKLIYTNRYSSIRFINEKTGFWLKTATDESALLLRTDDSGVSWKEVPMSMPLGSSYQIDFLDEKIGMIYGFSSSADDYLKLLTIDGGSTWQKVDNKHPLFIEKYKLLRQTIPLDQFFINDSTGFMGNYSNNYFARTKDSGRTWTTIKVDPKSGSNESVKKIFFTDSKNGFAIYYGKIGKTTDGGNTWAPIEMPYPLEEFIDMHSPDKKTIYFAGNIAYQSQPIILKATDNGKIFEEIKITLNSLSGIYSICFQGTKAWLVSTTGELYRSDDTLKTWQVLNEEINMFRGKVAFKNKWGLAGADFDAANKNKMMAYMTYDGGRTWKDIKLPAKLGESFVNAPKVKVFNDSNAIALTEAVLYETSDRGKTWKAFEQPFNKKNAGFINHFYPISEEVWFLNHRFGNEQYKLYKTIDGGHSWRHIPDVVNPYQGFYFFNNSIGFVQGNSTGWYRTTDGGETWKNINTGSASVFSGVNIAFADNFHGYFVGAGTTDNRYVSKILRTIDNGNTWEEIKLSENIKARQGLNEIKFLTDRVGYAIGRDFMIKTTDGGLTWIETTRDQFFKTYASLINFDETYSITDGDYIYSKLYHLGYEDVAAKPHQPNGNASVCISASPVNLYSVDNNDSYSYQWNIQGASGLIGTFNRNEINIKWPKPGNYKLTVKAINNCGESETQSIPVTVNNPAEKPTLVSGELAPCLNTNYTYQLNALNNHTYEWIVSAGLPAKFNKNTADITWKTADATFTIKALANNGSCPGDTLSFDVKPQPLPKKPTITINQTDGILFTSSSAINNQWFYENAVIEGATQQTFVPTQGTGAYSLQVSNVCGVATSENIHITISSIEEEQDYAIESYPNPTTHEIVIRSKQSLIDNVYLYDISGKAIKQVKEPINSTYKLNVSDLNSGIYLLKIISKGHVINRKVVIYRE